MGFLERLELENFKSYKGMQIIGPFRRFTAIIGPNGAGKSNMMDAISFVLGEQTKNLRVKSLKDLIHGAPIGKPVATTARVTAVYNTLTEEEDDSDIGLDTTDELQSTPTRRGTKRRRSEGNKGEIRFTRVITEHRSTGDKSDWKSVYKINDKVTSAAEYTAKLESIGIFIKAKNFLVFQGAVESIAMKTPKERTQLFEEISRSKDFISDYEKKKTEMNKAHEETNFAFKKKKGISAEKKEARAEKEEADRYQKLKEELADAQVKEQLFKLFHNEKEIEELDKSLRIEQKSLDKQTRRRQNAEAELKAKKQENAKCIREMNTYEQKIREKEVELNRLKPQYIKAKENTAHVLKRLEANKKSKEKVKEIHKKHQDEVKSLEAELREVDRLAERFEQEISEASEHENLQLLDSQVAEYHRLKELAGQKSVALTQSLEKIKHDQRTDEESYEQLKMKKNEFKNRLQQLENERLQHEQRIDKLDEEIKNHTDHVNKLRIDCEKLGTEVNHAGLRYTELNDALEGVEDHLKHAKADFHESARQLKRTEILENLKRLFPGVMGRLIDLCEPAQRKYAIALTKVLGKNMDAIVVDKERTGKECIQYIKEQHEDPCTFIPLDTIQAKPVNESLRTLGENVRLVIDVVKFSPEIKPALLYACGNTLICETMEDARKIAFDGSERRKTVSLDGALYQKTGIISGGTSDIKRKAKRWDEKQVDNLRQQRERYLSEIRDVTVVRRKEPELKYMQSQITGLESKVTYLKRDKENIEKRLLARNANEAAAISEKLQEIEPKIANIESKLSKTERDVSKTMDSINKVEDQVFRAFCKMIGVANIRQYEEQHLQSQQERTKKRLEFANQKSRLQNQLQFEKQKKTAENVEKLRRHIKEDEKSIANLQSNENRLLKSIEDVEKNIESIKLDKQKLQEQYDEKDAEVKGIRKMFNGYNKEMISLQKKINTIETESDQKKADRHSILKACKMGSIQLPMVRGSMDDIGDVEESGTTRDTASSQGTMDIDSMSSQGARVLYERESHITIDYSQLDISLQELSGPNEVKSMAQELNTEINKLHSNLQRIAAPNMKALGRLDDVESRLQETASAFEKFRVHARKTKQEFERIKKKRFDRFNTAFEHVTASIDHIYKKLSNNQSAQAFLGAENAEEPYLDGISYNCIVPGKRFRPMDNLSGGEKTVAALALLFAIQSFQTAPFFVLDEIDAALDNTNITRVAKYITEKTKTDLQCIVISLKEELYSHADAIVGIYCEPGGECTVSETLTLDLTQYDSPSLEGATTLQTTT